VDVPRQYQALHDAIGRAGTILLTTHLNPDGDALGSEVAFARVLSKLGKSVHIVNSSPTPSQYRLLEQLFPIQVYSEAHSQLVANCGLIMALDANQLARLGSMEASIRRSRAPKAVIDHHPNGELFADITIIDEATAATGQIVLAIVESLFPGSLDAGAASALYVAIMTDTGSFRFPKTDAALFRSVASLVDAGADPVALADGVYNSGTANRLLLLGLVLQSLTTSHSGRVASLVATGSMFKETGTDETDTENVINHALSIDDVVIALLFTEIPGYIKVSFRSKGDIPVNALARDFGGNGHTNAAGARIAGGKLQEVIERVTARAAHYLGS
jgi:bifunctional oligoribonuclease and PAP phosphatase NrnA